MPPRFPPWLKKDLVVSGEVQATRELLAGLGLVTVCAEAHCPNQAECFAQRTATFMILGHTCTRGCRFCAVEGGRPLAPQPDEPERVAQAAVRLGLKHVVVTSVTRDDLADGGAAHFAATIEAVRNRLPGAAIEVLTPDFQGAEEAVARVVAARPHIFNHNVETVPGLYRQVRPGADYHRSLEVLAAVKRQDPGVYTKSGLMVGLGERRAEVEQVMADLREAGCDALTIGQYLSPSAKHLPVQEFVPPETFAAYRLKGEEMGFLMVLAGPYVRSSYQAAIFSRRFAPNQDRVSC